METDRVQLDNSENDDEDEECDHSHVPCPSPNDYEECLKCGKIVDMRG